MTIFKARHLNRRRTSTSHAFAPINLNLLSSTISFITSSSLLHFFTSSSLHLFISSSLSLFLSLSPLRFFISTWLSLPRFYFPFLDLQGTSPSSFRQPYPSSLPSKLPTKRWNLLPALKPCLGQAPTQWALAHLPLEPLFGVLLLTAITMDS